MEIKGSFVEEYFVDEKAVFILSVSHKIGSKASWLFPCLDDTCAGDFVEFCNSVFFNS
jgi:hypothetical protein